MSAHDRFESLAGAVMLGEATPDERATFDAHAAACVLCRDDAAGGALVVAHIARANESETWRPSQPIAERLRARRSTRTRFTLGVLGWSVALSLVLNVAIVSGIGSRVGAAFLSVTQPVANVASTRITLESARRLPVPVSHASTWHPKTPVALHVRIAHRRVTSSAGKGRTRVATPHDPTIEDMPDVLAGVDLYGDGNVHRAVAHVALPRCAAHASDVEDETAARPCRDAAGRIEREAAP